MIHKLQENLQGIRTRIQRACEASGRPDNAVTLVAVTKTVSLPAIEAAWKLGLRDFGENRIQHLVHKAEAVRSTLESQSHKTQDEPTWHVIGHLQTNKVKAALRWSNTIHSVDSLRLAESINSVAMAHGKTADVFLQVNISGEETKYGLNPNSATTLAQQIQVLYGLRLVGLMTMAPYYEDPEQARPIFAGLRELSQELCERHLILGGRAALSMGMSNDFEIALEEGATIVRIGTELFEGCQS